MSESVTGTKTMVGAPYFNRVNVPIFIAIIILMGIGPVVAWKRSTTKALWKNLRVPLIVTTLLTLALFGTGMKNWMTLSLG